MNNIQNTDNKILFLEFSENQQSFTFDYEAELRRYTFGRIHILSEGFQTFLLDGDMGIFMIYKFKDNYHLHCLTKHIYLFEKIKYKYHKNLAPNIGLPLKHINLLSELIELNRMRYHTGNEQEKEKSKKILNYIYGEYSKLLFRDRFLSYTILIPTSIKTDFQDIIKLGYWLTEEMSKINELRLNPGISTHVLQDWIYYTLYPNLNFLDKLYTSTSKGLTPLELKKEMQIVSIPNKFNE